MTGPVFCPSAKFIVSSRASGSGPTQQVTIPAAIARKLPAGKSIRWEVSVVEDGLFYRYLGQGAPIDVTPEIELPFVTNLSAEDAERPFVTNLSAEDAERPS